MSCPIATDPPERMKHFIKRLSTHICVRLYSVVYIFMEGSNGSGDDDDADVRTRGANYKSPIIYMLRNC